MVHLSPVPEDGPTFNHFPRAPAAAEIDFPSEGALPDLLDLDDLGNTAQKRRHDGQASTASPPEMGFVHTMSAPGQRRRRESISSVASHVSLRTGQVLFDIPSEHQHPVEIVGSLNSYVDVSHVGSSMHSQISARSSYDIAKQASIFDEHFSEKLATEDPQLYMFLMRTIFGRLAQVSLVAVNVVISAGTTVVQSTAMKADPPPQGAAILLAYYVLSAIVGCVMFLLNIKSNGGLALFSGHDFLKTGALSLIFAPANLFNLLAFGTSLEAGTIVVIGTLRLPLMAAVSTFVLKRAYRVTSYVSLLVVALCACTVFQGAQQLAQVANDREVARSPQYLACQDYSNMTALGITDGNGVITCSAAGSQSSAKDDYLQGVIFTALSIGLSIIGNTLAERLLKKSDKPVYIHLIYTSLASIIINIPLSFVVPLVFQADEPERRWWASTKVVCDDGSEVTVGGGGLLTNWGSFATLTAIIKVVKYVTSMLILKKMSAIVRTLGSNMALILVVLYGELVTKSCWADEMPVNMYTSIVVMVLCVVHFSVDSGKAVGD